MGFGIFAGPPPPAAAGLGSGIQTIRGGGLASTRAVWRVSNGRSRTITAMIATACITSDDVSAVARREVACTLHTTPAR
jgi:hypothetical protein